MTKNKIEQKSIPSRENENVQKQGNSVHINVYFTNVIIIL